MNKSGKNRITYVTADFGKPQPINGIKLDPTTGQVVVPVPHGHMEELDSRFKRYESAPGNLYFLKSFRQE